MSGRGGVRARGPERRAGPRRGQGIGVRMRGGGIPRAARTVVSDEIRATIIDHVINHGLSLREAGERVQPNLRRSTVASIIRTFQQTNRMQRLPPSGGRGKLLSNDQELAIVEMVTANNAIKLREIQTRIVADHEIFDNIDRISLTTISRTLSKHRVRMKQLYTVPFERNSERVKELRRQYVQRVMELEANQAPHEFIYIDEAGFNLAKRRRRGRNVIGKRATVDVPGLRGANITMCAAIANAGLLLHRCQVGPYNTERLLAFLNDLHQRLVPEQGQEGENMRTFVITWDNVAFHHSQAITTWFEVHPRLVSLFLPPYSPFLNPIEEFFSAWRWKVYDHQPHDQMSLLEAMDAGSRDITVDDCQGWIRHTRRFYPRCIDLADIRCDVDENMWPNPEDRRD
ncbi:uncharacterized protein LOC113014096 isoform X1 [Astatotilapia calliptera]|uniref:uncharacterized protein LOC113014096 isoform X1 n=1 Tax=Astatotilapia calliptera TaxID=8154 RepID=UPI000E424171|nr:uncharacterized protein LOC113014096 isoform X1 [Astatotilapia calliptera]